MYFLDLTSAKYSHCLWRLSSPCLLSSSNYLPALTIHLKCHLDLFIIYMKLGICYVSSLPFESFYNKLPLCFPKCHLILYSPLLPWHRFQDLFGGKQGLSLLLLAK